MLLKEVMVYCKDNKDSLCIVYMDVSKVFDVVDYDFILNYLYDYGIIGKLWSLYNSFYTSIRFVIKW